MNNTNLNFLFAVLIGVLVITLAMTTRNCGRGSGLPSFIDRAVTIEEAQTRSRESGRPVLVLVGADWCEVCQRFNRGALSDRKVVAWIRGQTEPVYYDASKSRERDFDTQATLARLGVSSLPAVVLVRGGNRLGRIEGAIPAKDLLDWLQKTAAPPEVPAEGG